jgi:aspartyl protease family protein
MIDMNRDNQDPYNQNDGNKPPQSQQTKQLGKGFYAVAWILAIFFLTSLFSGHEQKRINPNQSPQTSLINGGAEVILKQNRQGHYVTNGLINGQPVTFLLDTGATDVAVPGKLAEKLNLKKGRPLTMNTANGSIRVYESWVKELKLGELVITDVDANINPNMDEDFILLGMSALKDLELIQRNNQLTIRQLY